MSEGLTYDTRSQAETMADDYHNRGYITNIVRTREGKFKVLLSSGYVTAPEEEEDLPLEDIGEEDKEEEEERRAAKKEMTPAAIEARRLTAKKAELERRNRELGRQGKGMWEIVETRDPETYKITDYRLVPLDPSLATRLGAKRKNLEMEMERQKSWGIEPGIITEVHDPETREIIDYKITHPGGRPGVKKIKTGITEAPIRATEFTTGITKSLSRQIDVKKGMKASIPGQAPEPRAIIAALPQRDVGAIGTARPAIGKMESIDTSKIELPTESLLKSLPRTKRLAANGQRDVGFAKMPGLRKPKRVQEEE